MLMYDELVVPDGYAESIEYALRWLFEGKKG
jgi:hypothetical protein